MPSERAPGFYWVKLRGEDWVVAEWDTIQFAKYDAGWLIPGEEEPMKDEWLEIGERIPDHE